MVENKKKCSSTSSFSHSYNCVHTISITNERPEDRFSSATPLNIITTIQYTSHIKFLTESSIIKHERSGSAFNFCFLIQFHFICARPFSAANFFFSLSTQMSFSLNDLHSCCFLFFFFTFHSPVHLSLLLAVQFHFIFICTLLRK